jgi:hypothetical protein
MAAKSRVAHLACEVDDSPPFHLYTALEGRSKRYELRLLLEGSKWCALYPGAFDQATLKVTSAQDRDRDRSFTRRVVGTSVSVGYRSTLERLGVQNCVPGAVDADDAIERVYARFYPHHLAGYEVLAIELE